MFFIRGYAFMALMGSCLAVSTASGDLADSPTLSFSCNGEFTYDNQGRPGFLPGSWVFEGDCVGSTWGQSYEVSAIVDPRLDFNFIWTNTSSAMQSYTFHFSLSDIDNWDGPVAFDGALSAVLNDLNGNGASLSNFGGASLYAGQVDGTQLLSLFNAPFAYSAAAGGSTAIGPESGSGSGLGGYASELGVQLSFTLSAGDSVSFTGHWNVVPVPAPSALALCAAVGLFGRRRR
ncbi:MAG: hypothetical protein O2800_04705 [Planctomycetota bacterium]|nr:hypothetical protein [Planctomycetota bacterium]